ncbi:uncharacterized protein LAJ45_11769 [Morchella importuna]|uniref:uncharacterized protein n=1 Tax=Morchella importuna TaxID=1174673 RepID=UPI001E8CB438|nr:uncharacterized protein LAJ45_11769 [Morchella importuna]KAH8144256.1 hypothetical protein LAJ45_11769 [Morchella importuna]
MGQSLLYCNYAFHPLADWPMGAHIKRLDANGSNYLDKIITAHESVRDTLQKPFDRMASKSGLAVQHFTISQKVLIDTRNLGGYSKWSDKFTGPFTVSAMVGNRAYLLELQVIWKVHEVLQLMLLTLYREDPNPTRQRNTQKRLATPEPQEELADGNFQPTSNIRSHMRSQGPVVDYERSQTTTEQAGQSSIPFTTLWLFQQGFYHRSILTVEGNV